jgi:hypothetical protein
MPRTALAAVITAVIMSLVSAAAAQDTTVAPNFQPQDQQPIEYETAWYGYQVVGADIVVTGAAFLVGPASLYGLLLTGPTVHLLNGENGKALASLGFRVGAPLAGVLIGGALDDSECDDFCLFEAGQAVGIAVVADWLVLPRKKTDRPRRVVVPFTTVENGGAVASLTGTF